MNGLANRGSMSLEQSLGDGPIQVPLRDRLISERRVHSERVERIDRALKLLEKNPDIEELMNIL